MPRRAAPTASPPRRQLLHQFAANKVCICMYLCILRIPRITGIQISCHAAGARRSSAQCSDSWLFPTENSFVGLQFGLSQNKDEIENYELIWFDWKLTRKVNSYRQKQKEDKVSTKGEFYDVKPGGGTDYRRRHTGGDSTQLLLTTYNYVFELLIVPLPLTTPNLRTSWSKLRENYFKKQTVAMMSNFFA